MRTPVYDQVKRLIAPAMFAAVMLGAFGRGAAPFVAFCTLPRVGTTVAHLLALYINRPPKGAPWPV